MKDIELPPQPAAVGIKLRLFRWALLSGDREAADHHLVDLKKAIDDPACRAVEADRAQRVPEEKTYGPYETTDELFAALLASTPAPAQQEPVLVVDENQLQKLLKRPEADKYIKAWPGVPISPNEVALYTRPAHQEPPQQERKPMTDAQAVKCIEAAGFKTWTSAHFRLVRQAERHHGIFAEPAQDIKE